jgi:hypothetical protein
MKSDGWGEMHTEVPKSMINKESWFITLLYYFGSLMVERYEKFKVERVDLVIPR